MIRGLIMLCIVLLIAWVLLQLFTPKTQATQPEILKAERFQERYAVLTAKQEEIKRLAQISSR